MHCLSVKPLNFTFPQETRPNKIFKITFSSFWRTQKCLPSVSNVKKMGDGGWGGRDKTSTCVTKQTTINYGYTCSQFQPVKIYSYYIIHISESTSKVACTTKKEKVWLTFCVFLYCLLPEWETIRPKFLAAKQSCWCLAQHQVLQSGIDAVDHNELKASAHMYDWQTYP